MAEEQLTDKVQETIRRGQIGQAQGQSQAQANNSFVSFVTFK